jgi:hypothetical protein
MDGNNCLQGLTGKLQEICYSTQEHSGINGSMDDNQETPVDKITAKPTSRRALMLGAAAVSAVVTVRPALAQTAGSVLNCEIPVPGPHGTGMNIDAHGALVTPDTPGSFTATGQKFTGEQVKRALGGAQLPGTTYEQNQAYVNYIRRLQAGQSGFTCYASLQMPR